MPPRRSRRNQTAADADTVILQSHGAAVTAPQAAPDSNSDDYIIPNTYTTAFTIPQASGVPIPSFMMQQPVGQTLVENALPVTAPGGLHAVSLQAIDDMINSAVTRALQ